MAVSPKRRIGSAAVLALCMGFLVPACRREAGGPDTRDEARTEKARPSAPIPEPVREGEIPLLTEDEVRKLAALKEKDAMLDAVRANLYSFGYKYEQNRERLEPLLHAEGLDRRTFTHLIAKVYETRRARAKILDPYEAMKRFHEDFERDGGQVEGPGAEGRADPEEPRPPREVRFVGVVRLGPFVRPRSLPRARSRAWADSTRPPRTRTSTSTSTSEET
jgi:hypothetical protein